MAGGSKVREWMRRRMAPRRKAPAAAAGSGGGDSSHEAASESSAQSSPRRKLREGVSSSALRRTKPAGARNALAALFQRAAYNLLWLVESVVVVARLVFFFVRFGFRL